MDARASTASRLGHRTRRRPTSVATASEDGWVAIDRTRPLLDTARAHDITVYFTKAPRSVLRARRTMVASVHRRSCQCDALLVCGESTSRVDLTGAGTAEGTPNPLTRVRVRPRAPISNQVPRRRRERPSTPLAPKGQSIPRYRCRSYGVTTRRYSSHSARLLRRKKSKTCSPSTSATNSDRLITSIASERLPGNVS
jgi:hypothetical protein